MNLSMYMQEKLWLEIKTCNCLLFDNIRKIKRCWTRLLQIDYNEWLIIAHVVLTQSLRQLSRTYIFTAVSAYSILCAYMQPCTKKHRHIQRLVTAWHRTSHTTIRLASKSKYKTYIYWYKSVYRSQTWNSTVIYSTAADWLLKITEIKIRHGLSCLRKAYSQTAAVAYI